MATRAFIKLVALWFVVTLGAVAHGADPIKIGAVLSVTGPAAYLGEPELKTLEMYIEKINKEGGVLGRKLELIHYDDGSDSNKANSFAKRLIENDHVDLIIGGTTTGSTMAMVPLVQQAGVPFISLAGGVVIVEPVKNWVFKTPHTDRMAAEKVFEDMQKRGISKVGLLSETSGFGQSGRKETLAVAPKYGITIVADETYGPKDTDVSAQLTKLKNTPGVQAIFVFGLGQGPAVVTKNYAQLGMTNLPLYQSHGVASEEYIKLSGNAAEGVRLPAAALLVADKLPADDPQKNVVTEYTQSFTDRLKTQVSTFGGHAYDALMIAVEAIKKAGSTDKEKVRAAIEQTKGFVGTGGVVNMSPTDHMGLDLSAFRMLEVKNGDWSLISLEGATDQLKRGTAAGVSSLAQFLQFLFSGLTVGAMYALAALGFSLIYNASGVINFAQGEFIMLGGMAAVFLVAAGLPLPIAIVLALVIAAVVGLLVEKLAIEPAKNAEVVTLIIITIGAALFIRGLVQVFLGKGSHALPHFTGDTPIPILGATLLPQSLWVIGVTIAVVLALGWFFERTLLGKAMLATAYNKLAAQLVGINTRMILLLSFGLAAVLGALGGIIVAPITYTSYDAGIMLGLKGFVAATLGGLGSGVGAVVGGLILGIVEAMTAGYGSSAYKDAVPFVLILLILFFMPRGLFGAKVTERV